MKKTLKFLLLLSSLSLVAGTLFTFMNKSFDKISKTEAAAVSFKIDISDVTNAFPWGGAGVLWYDSNNSYLSKSWVSASSNELSVTSPSNAKYVKLEKNENGNTDSTTKHILIDSTKCSGKTVKIIASQSGTTNLSARWIDLSGAKSNLLKFDVEGKEKVNVYSWQSGDIDTTIYAHYTDQWPGIEVEKNSNGYFSVYIYDMYIVNVDGKQTDNKNYLDYNGWQNIKTQNDCAPIFNFTVGSDSITQQKPYFKTFYNYNNNYCRIWMDRNGHYAETNYTFTLHYWKSGGIDAEVSPHFLEVDNNGRYLIYFDVYKKDILEATYQFKVYRDGDGAFQFSYGDSKYTSGDNAEIVYLNDSSFSFGGFGDTKSLNDNTVKCYLDGYFTCSSDLDNGYGKWSGNGIAYNTWVCSSSGHWYYNGNLNEIVYTDFKSKNQDSYPSGRTDGNTQKFDAYSKILELTAGSSRSRLSFYKSVFTDLTDGSSSNPTLIILISSVVTGLAIGGYFLLRKRKED